MKNKFKKIILIFVLWVLIINFFALFSLNRFNFKGDTAYTWINPEQLQQEQNWDLTSLHARWDSFWYLDIAKNGYSFNGEGKLSNIVFFPLYPFLIKTLSLCPGIDFILAGWMLTLVFLLLSLFYLFKLVKEFHPKINPYDPIFLLLIFPTAFFLNAIYTESLFLFLSLATFYYALKGEYKTASIFGLLASLTRITGILLFIPLLWEYFKKHNLNLARYFKLDFLSIFLIPLGTLSFFVFHHIKFNDFFLFLKVQSWWGRTFNFNEEHFTFFTNPAIVNFIIDVLFVAFALLITYFVFKKLRVSYGIYMLSTLAIALSTGTFMSIGRYILILFPIYILGASIKNQYLKQIWIFISILLLSMNIILFVNNYWAG